MDLHCASCACLCCASCASAAHVVPIALLLVLHAFSLPPTCLPPASPLQCTLSNIPPLSPAPGFVCLPPASRPTCLPPTSCPPPPAPHLLPLANAVYIGDSMTDIPPLISADAGILVGRNDMVRQVAAVAGVCVRVWGWWLPGGGGRAGGRERCGGGMGRRRRRYSGRLLQALPSDTLLLSPAPFALLCQASTCACLWLPRWTSPRRRAMPTRRRCCGRPAPVSGAGVWTGSETGGSLLSSWHGSPDKEGGMPTRRRCCGRRVGVSQGGGGGRGGGKCRGTWQQ